MSRTLPLGSVCLWLAVALGCAPLAPREPSPQVTLQSGGSSSAGRSGDVVTSSELSRVTAVSAWEALARLRPELVRPSMTAPTASTLPILYLDGVRHGRIDLLTGFRVEVIDDMRYYRPSEASGRFGVRDGSAVLAVRMRKG